MWKARILHKPAIRFLLLLWRDMTKVDIFKDAYAMAYVTLFSLIPSLAACFALVSLFTPLFEGSSDLLDNAKIFILKNLATGSGEQVIHYLENFLSNTDFKKIGITGFVSTLVTLTLLLQQIEMSLNNIFEVKEKRSMIQRFLYFWTILTLGTFSLAISIGTLSSFAWSSRYLDLSLSQKIVRDIFYMGGMFGLFLVLYKFGPNRFVRLRSAAIGAGVSTILLIQALRFFSLYITKFTRYEAIYGALAAVPSFLLWLYVMWLITLFGGIVAKRSMEGLPHGSFDSPIFNKQIKPYYFEAILPFIVLLKTYEKFDKGEPCFAEDIAKDLSVTSTVVRKAYSDLILADLVICRHNEDRKGGAEEFYPRFPEHKLSFGEAKKKLLGDAEKWLGSVAELSGSIDGAHYQKALEAYLLASEKPISQLRSASKASASRS